MGDDGDVANAHNLSLVLPVRDGHEDSGVTLGLAHSTLFVYSSSNSTLLPAKSMFVLPKLQIGPAVAASRKTGAASVCFSSQLAIVTITLGCSAVTPWNRV
jgi:hypothetical protein